MAEDIRAEFRAAEITSPVESQTTWTHARGIVIPDHRLRGFRSKQSALRVQKRIQKLSNVVR